jgi:hypothetical protein
VCLSLCAGNAPPPEEIDWIKGGQHDIYAFGVQESCYTLGDDGAVDGGLATEMHWNGLLDTAIGEVGQSPPSAGRWITPVAHARAGQGYEEVCCQTLSPRTDDTFRSATAFKGGSCMPTPGRVSPCVPVSQRRVA